MPKYDDFVFNEIRRIGRAWVDKNNDGSGVYDIEQLFEKIGEMSWRRLIDRKSMFTILTEIGVNPNNYGESDSPIIIPPNAELIKFPRYGMSINALVNASKCNIQETVKRFVDAGVQSTRINLITALFPEIDCLPFTQLPNGEWDLFAWNAQYFERIQEVKESMNKVGIQIQWTNRELYSWSHRKYGIQQNNTFWRNNVNGIFWEYDSNDIMFGTFPYDGFSIKWFEKICPLLDLTTNTWEIGNEFPEKGVHERDRDEIRKIVPNALIQVNRNDDTPGQYTNMKIGEDYDFIAFHGRLLKSIGDLDNIYSKEPDYKTFQEFIDKCPHDRKRVIFSSDGARINKDSDLGITETYDYPVLGRFGKHLKALGYNYEHQSRAKMTPPPNHHMIEVDWFLDTFVK